MDWNILIVEDEAKLREVLCDFLRSKGEIPAEAADGVQALGLLERVSAVLFHLFATSLVFTAVIRRNPLWYFAAVAAHTLFNSLAVLLAGFGLLAVELVLFALGLAMGAWVLASRRRWPA